MSKPATIKVFFDSNILHTNQAHLLLPSKVIDYIKGHRVIESVEILWYIPEMVIEERRHQMQLAAESLLPRLHDLEKVIGHNLAINVGILRSRIADKINATIKENKLNAIPLDTSKVNLAELIDRSVKRLPPFEKPGENEKGFRDAVIANTFFQEVENSPKTQRVCRLVFVSGDSKIREYIKDKTASCSNVRILESMDDLKSLINAIASEVTEEFLSKISEDAKKYFYDFDKQEGLYNSEKIHERIKQNHEPKLNMVVTGYEPQVRRIEDGITLGDQTFIDKTGQTVKWTKDVLFKFKLEQSDSSVSHGLFTIEAIMGADAPKSKVIATGQSRFRVHWQHQISTKGKISRAKVTNIEFIENEFDNSKGFKSPNPNTLSFLGSAHTHDSL